MNDFLSTYIKYIVDDSGEHVDQPVDVEIFLFKPKRSPLDLILGDRLVALEDQRLK